MRRRKYFKKKLNKLSFVQKNILLIICCYVLVSLSSIGYAAFQKAINITGDLLLRAPSGVEVSALNFVATSDGMELYNSRFTSDTASISVNIPNVNDKVFYSMTLTNYGDTPMELTSLIPTLSVSDQITCYMYTGSGEFTTGYVLESNSSVSVYIELTRTKIVGTSGTNFSLLIEFAWEEYVPVLASGPNVPDLLNNSLVPVIYDESANSGDGAWVVVSPDDENWYDYSTQKWANAVILNSGVTKNVGDTVLVPTEDSTDTEVRAMYVWIPRYSYTIKSEDGENYYGKTLSELGADEASLETPGAIDIKFVSTNINETGNAQYIGDTASNWRTHPAFNWDNDDNGSISTSEQLSGIWVGKFETSGSGDTPTIVPNLVSLREQNVFTQFTTAQKFGTYLSNSSNTDSHMMKNSEWGAVAYLSQSSYGKYGNSDYTGANKEVYINNNFDYITGYSGESSSSSESSVNTYAYNGKELIFEEIPGSEKEVEYYYDAAANCYQIDEGSYYCDDSFNTPYMTVSFTSLGKTTISFDWDVTVETDYYSEGLIFWVEDRAGNNVIEQQLLNNTLYENGELSSQSIEVVLEEPTEYFLYFQNYFFKTDRGMYVEINNLSIVEPEYNIIKGDKIVGVGASTTGNIYGVYDMSGGSDEYIMGYLTIATDDLENNFGAYYDVVDYKYYNHSGFTIKPANKYFDAYTTEESTTACNEGICYGHALSETHWWYSDYAGFVTAEYPWFSRGGYYGSTTSAGVFNSGGIDGAANGDNSFRSVVLPTGA